MKQTFVECSSNILETLRDYWNLPKDQHLLLSSNYTLLTQKQLFHRELFKKSFQLKCSPNVLWMFRTLQHHNIACQLMLIKRESSKNVFLLFQCNSFIKIMKQVTATNILAMTYNFLYNQTRNDSNNSYLSMKLKYFIF